MSVWVWSDAVSDVRVAGEDEAVKRKGDANKTVGINLPLLWNANQCREVTRLTLAS